MILIEKPENYYHEQPQLCLETLGLPEILFRVKILNLIKYKNLNFYFI